MCCGWTDLPNRFIPPKLNREKSNVENSENSTLFLLSCYQYILSGIVLSVGPPFRQSMTRNRRSTSCWPKPKLTSPTVPFVVTIVVAVLFTSYMLFDPAEWLSRFVQLTKMSMGFKVFLLVLAMGGFVFAWLAERRFFPWLAAFIGKAHNFCRPGHRKKRKQYKLLLEKMRI